MADEDVGEEQTEEASAEAEVAVETATDPPAADADGGAAAEVPEGGEAAPDAEAETASDQEGADDPAAGQEALDAVETIENQLGEVLSNLDGLGTDRTVTGFDADADPVAGTSASIDLLRDVQLNVKIELGRSHMYIEDILKLGSGSVVELEKLAGDPVDVFVNDRLVARGEVLVLNDNFCVRIGEIVSQD